MAQTAEFKKGDNPELTSLQNYKAWLTTIKGARTIELTSRPERAAANKLYRKLGFERRNTNVYRYTPP